MAYIEVISCRKGKFHEKIFFSEKFNTHIYMYNVHVKARQGFFFLVTDLYSGGSLSFLTHQSKHHKYKCEARSKLLLSQFTGNEVAIDFYSVKKNVDAV